MNAFISSRQQLTSASTLDTSWVCRLKGVALIWIMIGHAVERWLGCPYFANPSADWPELQDRFDQVRPFVGSGLWDWIINPLRYVGWTGDTGVTIFLVLSGFGLTWSGYRRGAPRLLPVGDFYRRRLSRLLPLWWGAHFIVLLPLALINFKISIVDWQFWFSLVGLRCYPEQMYYGIASWWFVGLILQIYLIFPLLWAMSLRWGGRSLLALILISLLVRGIGLQYCEVYLDAWQRGAVFVTRLPEFLFGMLLARTLLTRPDAIGRIASWPVVLSGALLCLGAFALSFTLIGCTISPILLAIGTLPVGLKLVGTHDRHNVLSWLGSLSYPIYLLHGLCISALVPNGFDPAHVARPLIAIAAAILCSVIVAICFDISIRQLQITLRVRPRLCQAMLTAGAAIYVSLLVGESHLRTHFPQECSDLGWGERPMLETNDQFTWRMRPGQAKRLRWESYDYLSEANELGFPAPLYPEARSGEKLRVMVVGDAFTSAEGVDTARAWPRLMEHKLQTELGYPVEVLNFAVTGYGPFQYAAVVEEFLPRFKPDLLILALFVNDFEEPPLDQQRTWKEMSFHRPGQNSWQGYLTCRHVFRFVRNHILEPTAQRLAGNVGPYRRNFLQLDRYFVDDSAESLAHRQVAADCYEKIAHIAKSAAVPVIAGLIPASIEVCSPEELVYFPTHINLADTERYDLERPQRIAMRMLSRFNWQLCDLREHLAEATTPCYQPRNMHWTEAGHEIAATCFASEIQNREAFQMLPVSPDIRESLKSLSQARRHRKNDWLHRNE